MFQDSIKKHTKYLVCVSAMVIALSAIVCFGNGGLRQDMLNFINKSCTQAIGISARRNASPSNILVNYKEFVSNEKMDVLELYIDDENSFYVINRYFFAGSNGSFEGLENFYRTKSAREAVNNFFDRQNSSVVKIR